MFQEFIRMVERSKRFIPIVFFDEFAPDAFLPQDAVPWRVIAVLLKE